MPPAADGGRFPSPSAGEREGPPLASSSTGRGQRPSLAERAARGARGEGAPTGRSLLPLVLAALLGLFLGDALKPPREQAGARLAVGAIDAYRAALSPLLSKTGLARCRFAPSCSAYGREAVSRYGLARGTLLTAGRILRCHPFAKGGADPVP